MKSNYYLTVYGIKQWIQLYKRRHNIGLIVNRWKTMHLRQRLFK